jgi:ferritin
MLKPNVEKILNEQVKKEAYASFLYLAMASWADNAGYPGTSKWFYAQAAEENQHMLKIIGYINERGGKAEIPAVEQAPKSWNNIKDAFEGAYEHEKYVSESIYKIVELTLKEKDYATNNWIQWFVTEQIEEESSVNFILDKLNLFGEKINYYMFDRDILRMREE